MRWELILIGIAIILLAGVLFVGRDAPDWETTTNKTEITSRPNLIYPSGKVIFIDNFEAAAFMWGIGVADGGSGGLVGGMAFTEDMSVKLQTTGAVGSTAKMDKRIALPPSKKIGLECWYAFYAPTGGNIEFSVTYYDGTDALKASVKYNPAENNWTYYDSDGGDTVILGSTQKLYKATLCYHHMKLIADFSKGEYVRLYSNQNTWDLSGFAVNTTTPETEEHLYLEIQNAGTGVGTVLAFIDNVVVTEE